MTSESFGRFKAFNPKKIASVPFAQVMVYFEPTYLENLFSNLSTKSPKIKLVFFEINLKSWYKLVNIFLSCL